LSQVMEDLVLLSW